MGLLHIGEHEDVPLVVDSDNGIVRISGTRLKLQTVIGMYYMGCLNPEEMARRFDSLDAETAKRIIGWYHARRRDVDAYMDWVERRAEAVRAEVEPRVAVHRDRARRRVTHSRGINVRTVGG